MKTTREEIEQALVVGWPTWERESDQVETINSVEDLLRAERLAMLDELREFGCPHACTPPCPFHRRLADMRLTDMRQRERKQ